MIKKHLTLLLTIFLINFAFSATISANSKTDKFINKVKTEITKLGIGKDAQIKVKLKDGTKLKGYVSEINDDFFILMDSNTNKAFPINYSNAKQIKGNNLSKGAKIAIGVGLIVGFVAIIILAGRSD